MARNKVKIDELAKLRQFRKGDDVDDFLSTQFRQVVRAIEQAYVNPTDLSQYSTTQDLANSIAALNLSNYQRKADLYANVISSFAIGTVSLASRVLNFGSVSSNIFYPETDGKYWVDFGMQMIPVNTNVVNYLRLKQGASTTHELRGDLLTPGDNYYITGRRLVDITSSQGAWFDFQGDVDTIGTNFYCSFTKVS